MVCTTMAILSCVVLVLLLSLVHTGDLLMIGGGFACAR